MTKEDPLQHKSLGYLMGLSNHDFLMTMYPIILKREADEEGLTYYLKRLNNGLPRLLIIAEVLASLEAANHFRRYNMPDDCKILLRRYRWIKYLPLGRLRWLLLGSVKGTNSEYKAIWKEIESHQSSNCSDNDNNIQAINIARVANQSSATIENIHNDIIPDFLREKEISVMQYSEHHNNQQLFNSLNKIQRGIYCRIVLGIYQ
ncbi:DUF4214 domain-containing protein [Acidithiobacillus ferriphilus]|uniref:DUF4214 domain-containing protein n=1 Tax=Acidithiobacillus ferriphilus TaxID=1689834 RepID=UPI001C0755C8|nr:DUF4214 domain-containing protein [Acidithiobacillus ferriphilus]MBU2854847.1 DUF4214 domain-containing protein [Acidithiobacillus ferriphilus]